MVEGKIFVVAGRKNYSQIRSGFLMGISWLSGSLVRAPSFLSLTLRLASSCCAEAPVAVIRKAGFFGFTLNPIVCKV